MILIGTMAAGQTLAVDPAPELPPRARTWELDVRFHDPRRVLVRLPGDRSATPFWYMVYEVTNRTGEDRGFYPSFKLVTDTLEVVEGGANISPNVYGVVIAQHKREFPFLATPTQVTGRLLQGDVNSRASVVVFRDFDAKASAFTIYASGFSGDTQRLANPGFDTDRPETEENSRMFLLQRTLAIRYDLPGDTETRGRAKPIRRSRTWVMR